MKRFLIYLLVSLFTLSGLVLQAQQDFSPLRPIDARYKKLLKMAKEEDKLLLFIIHSPQVVNNTILLLDDKAKVEALNEKIITTVLDILKDDNHEVIRRIPLKANPTYVIMNHDEVILDQDDTLSNAEDLIQFYGRAIRVSGDFYQYKKELEVNATDENYRRMIALLLNNKNQDLAEEYIEDWMQELLPLKRESNHEFLAQVAEVCTCSERLNASFAIFEDTLMSSLGRNRYLAIRQAYILKELRRYDLVEPYTVWEVYNEQFGIYADSLFRRFAINYYQFVEPNKEILMDEVYDYLYYYPETAWAEQKLMFDLALKYSAEKDDMLLLLDMIEYQLYLGDDHEKKDIKAVIMYKLGNKERALQLMREVEEMQPDYVSRVHQIIEN